MLLPKSHTTYSLLQAIPSPKELIERCKELGYTSVAITEFSNLFSSVKIFQECQSKEIKPIMGCNLYIKDNNQIAQLTLLAKNLQGWKDLIKIVSISNYEKNYDLLQDKPTIDLDQLANNIQKDNLITYAGSFYSILGKPLFNDYNKAVYATLYEDVKLLVRTDWKEYLIKKIGLLQEIFGKNNFFYEIQNNENDIIPACEIVSKIGRYISQLLKIKKIATSKIHYLTKEDAADHRILICSANESSNLREIENKLIQKKDFDSLTFFRSSNNYLPTIEEFKQKYEKDEIDNLEIIDQMIEKYDILNPPQVPKFDCNNKSSIEYLRELCRKGWKKKVEGKIEKENLEKYKIRGRKELEVISGVNCLPDYLLIVQDIVNWAKDQGWLLSYCRGSVGGSLIAYLLNITNIDPIKEDLIFERFYNAGRNTATRIKLPDIDCDFPINKRKKVIEYIVNKYGSDKVGHISTFSGMKGRVALKDVLRAKQRCSFSEMNQITELIPDEAKIQDQLQKIKESGEEENKPSIIKWALENNEKLTPYCRVKDGKLEGEYAIDFAQAIRLEGIKRNRGKHAAGIVISQNFLIEGCPLVRDKINNELLCGLDMKDVESLGYLKMDVLGVAALDDIMNMINIIKTGKPNEFE